MPDAKRTGMYLQRVLDRHQGIKALRGSLGIAVIFSRLVFSYGMFEGMKKLHHMG